MELSWELSTGLFDFDCQAALKMRMSANENWAGASVPGLLVLRLSWHASMVDPGS